MELPEGVQALFLLKSVNLASESEKLARATAKLEYKDMREKLARIFGDPDVLDEKGRAPDVKEEVLYGQAFDRRKSGASRGKSGNAWKSDGGELLMDSRAEVHVVMRVEVGELETW